MVAVAVAARAICTESHRTAFEHVVGVAGAGAEKLGGKPGKPPTSADAASVFRTVPCAPGSALAAV